jgi:hypothetical protein
VTVTPKTDGYAIRLICKDRTVFADGMLLSRYSPVISAMFNGNYKESQTGKVEIPEMDSVAVALFVAYATYQRESNIPDGDTIFMKYATSVFELAVKYQVDTLKDRCAAWMWNNLTVDNCIRTLILAGLHDHAILKARCVKFMSQTSVFTKVLSVDGWKEFAIQHSELRELIEKMVAKRFAKCEKYP